MQMTDAVVVSAHRSNYPNPVSFDVGDRLEVGEKDTEYVGWVTVTDPNGCAGWAPIEYIELAESVDSGVALKRYSAKELDVEPGERLNVKFEHCQWCWVEHETKGAGWVPSECLNNA